MSESLTSSQGLWRSGTASAPHFPRCQSSASSLHNVISRAFEKKSKQGVVDGCNVVSIKNDAFLDHDLAFPHRVRCIWKSGAHSRTLRSARELLCSRRTLLNTSSDQPYDDSIAANSCNSLDLTGDFAGITLYLSHTFKSSPSCTSRKSLITVEVILGNRTTLTNVQPDFACDNPDWIRLQKP